MPDVQLQLRLVAGQQIVLRIKLLAPKEKLAVVQSNAPWIKPAIPRAAFVPDRQDVPKTKLLVPRANALLRRSCNKTSKNY